MPRSVHRKQPHINVNKTAQQNVKQAEKVYDSRWWNSTSATFELPAIASAVPHVQLKVYDHQTLVQWTGVEQNNRQQLADGPEASEQRSTGACVCVCVCDRLTCWTGKFLQWQVEGRAICWSQGEHLSLNYLPCTVTIRQRGRLSHRLCLKKILYRTSQLICLRTSGNYFIETKKKKEERKEG